MINVLLIVKDFNYGKNLINMLARINKNFRICGISSNKEESIFILNNMQLDIIIIELPLNNYEEIVKLIGKKRTTILVSDRKNEVKIIDNILNNGKVNYFIKNDNIAEDANKINCFIALNEIFKVPKMCKAQESKIKQKINGELKYLGYNLDHLGSKYIAETIYMLYIVKEYYNFNLERDIYPVIARKIGNLNL